MVHTERVVVRFLCDLQLIDRRRRVLLCQLDEDILVEVGENEPGIAQMVLVKILRTVSCYLPTGIFRHHATIWRVYIPMINMGT